MLVVVHASLRETGAGVESLRETTSSLKTCNSNLCFIEGDLGIQKVNVARVCKLSSSTYIQLLFINKLSVCPLANKSNAKSGWTGE